MEKESLEETEGIALLTLSGGEEREVGAEGLGAERGAITETEFAEDNGAAKTLLGLVVGGGHAVDIEEGEETEGIALRIKESLPEVFDAGMSERGAADSPQLTLERRFAALGFGESDTVMVPRLTETATGGKENA